MEFLFLLIGLGFFIWTINQVHVTQREERDHRIAVDREQYGRRMNEQREFGSLPISRDPPKETQHKK